MFSNIKKRLALRIVLIISIGLVDHCSAGLTPAGPRRLIRLDGSWQIAHGGMAEQPKTYSAQAPVPGLADMAQPAFEKVGFKNDLREAFWYRRVFKIEGEIPTVAMLKIHKAKYGTRVFLNGQLVGEQLPCFTPLYFDVKVFLKGNNAENEIVIRVGAYKDSVPRSIPDGWDFEKYRYIPGIYDSVDIILAGAPYIENVQTVPEIGDNTVGIEANLENPLHLDTMMVKCTLREASSGRLVFQDNAVVNKLAEYDSYPFITRLPVKDARLWTPEDPFLYELQLDTGGDAAKVRFGMRSFRFDKHSGRAVLNGKPYMMRGTNVCIYRFFEDDARGDRPWRHEWVQRLHRKFKGMNWNSIRYCIGFPPESWYDIADEEGFLIQDEFPIWYLGKENWPAELKSDEIAAEYRAWMRERWNHACVVIWDGQNESDTDETRKAIAAVRHLDLSNRPWDNGWAIPQSELDCLESHPYLFSRVQWGQKPFFLRDLADTSPVPRLWGRQTDYSLPIILNEYAWLWINRDGTTTSLTDKVYASLLGENSTTQQRRELYAKYLAALTEFWRSHRRCAAVMHFCGLGYSRAGDVPRPEGGATSDHFIDLEKLEFEPFFEQYVHDAFAPVGIMIDMWKDKLEAGQEIAIPIAVINDLESDFSGKVRLSWRQGDKVLAPPALDCRVEGLGRKVLDFAMRAPGETGKYVLEAKLISPDGKSVCSVRDVEITGDTK
jgi:hypothetical protein